MTTEHVDELPWEPKMRVALVGVEVKQGDEVRREEYSLTAAADGYQITGRHGSVFLLTGLLDVLSQFHAEGQSQKKGDGAQGVQDPHNPYGTVFAGHGAMGSEALNRDAEQALLEVERMLSRTEGGLSWGEASDSIMMFVRRWLDARERMTGRSLAPLDRESS